MWTVYCCLILLFTKTINVEGRLKYVDKWTKKIVNENLLRFVPCSPIKKLKK